MTVAEIGRPFLRIADHDLDDAPFVERRGWYFECRLPDGTVIAEHPGAALGLHVTQQSAFRAALDHLARGGCRLDGGAS